MTSGTTAGTPTAGPPAEDLLVAEDLVVGETIDLGDYFVSRSEIIDFASRWDPLPFHTDVDAARLSIFGDVVGSGVHLMAIFQRLAVLGAYRRWAIVAGRSIRDVQFTSPLRAETTVRATLTLDAITPHSYNRSSVLLAGRVLDQDLVLMSVQVEAYLLRTV